MLHAVEDGLVTLIGATTENPYFEVNAALLSRCTVIELEPLSPRIERSSSARGAEALGGGRRRTTSRAAIARRAGGDARAALQTLELAGTTADRRGSALTERATSLDAARKRPLRYDRDGDQHYDFISAFIKSMRGGDPDAAVYYLAAMLEGGEDPRFIARRMVILASEDVGNADPNALVVAVAAAQALEHVGLPEAQLNLAQAAIYLARAPKSNAVRAGDLGGAGATSTRGIGDARRRDARATRTTRRQRARGHGEGYVSRTTIPPASPSTYLPEGLRGRTVLSFAVRNGEEQAMAAIGTGDRAPEFDLDEAYDRPRVRLSDFRGSSNVLLVFHPFAFTAVCAEEALDLQENLRVVPQRRHRDRVRLVRHVRGPPGLEARARREYTFASDFWPHGAAAKSLRRLRRGDRRPAPRHVPDRQRRAS